MHKYFQYLIKNYIVVFFVLFIITIPLKQSMNSVSILALTFISLYYLARGRKIHFELLKKLYPFVIVFILIALSTFYSTDKEYAIKSIKRFLPFIVFPFIFSTLQLKKNHYIFLVRFYIFWILSLTLFTHGKVLIKLVENNEGLYDFFTRDYSYTNLSLETIGLHPSYFAYLILLGVVFITYFLFSEKKKVYKFLYTIALLYLSFFIFHLSARTPIIALFIFFNFAILYYFYSEKQFFKGIIYLLLLYIITAILGYNVRVTRYRFQHIFGFTYSSGIHHDDGINKLKQWNAAIHANNNMLFGNGIGDANNAIYKSYYNYDLDEYAIKEYNAHNQFIQTFVDLGLFGVFVLLLLFAYYFKLFYKNKFLIGYSFLTITFILFQTESYFQSSKGTVVFSFVICVFVSYLLATEKGNTNSSNNHKKLY